MKKLLSLMLSLALLLTLSGCGGVQARSGSGSADLESDSGSGAVTGSASATTLRYVEEDITPTLANGSAASIEQIQGWDDGSLDAFGYREWYHSEDGGDTWETRTMPEDFLTVLCVDGEGTLYGLGMDEENSQYIIYRYTTDGETATLPLDSGITSFYCCAIYDNRIAVVSEDNDDFTSTLYGVELATGATLWQRESSSSSPACFCYDGALYLCEDTYPSPGPGPGDRQGTGGVRRGLHVQHQPTAAGGERVLLLPG